jgi:hypothetical protein
MAGIQREYIFGICHPISVVVSLKSSLHLLFYQIWRLPGGWKNMRQPSYKVVAAISGTGQTLGWKFS